MTTTPPRLTPLYAQFDFAWNQLIDRLEGLTDDEYLWEPATGCWNVRRRDDVTTSRSIGGGDWRMEFDSPPPDPAPFTTIAWRMTHLGSSLALRADYTIGTKSLAWDTYEVAGSAVAAIEVLVASGEAWRSALTSATDADLDQVGRSTFPWGLDPNLPFLDIVWWVNTEIVHHAAEIALLRDLYRAQPH